MSIMKNIFKLEEANSVIERINHLNVNSPAVWGTMNAGQMLAHCNVTYDMDFTDKYSKAKGLKKLMLKLFVKSIVVSNKPYSKNSRTAPQFVITDKREFDSEKTKLVNYIKKVQELGESHYNGRESHSFGNLNVNEWNNMFYKHLDHHLKQFGV